MKQKKKIYESLTVTTGLIVGIILLIVLVTSPKWKIIQTETTTYGPYECESGALEIIVDEWQHRINGAQDIKVKLMQNGSLLSTEDFDEDNIGITYRLPYTNKCIPIVARIEHDTVQKIGTCLEKIIVSGQLKSDILSKKGAPFDLCSISEYVTGHAD